MALNKEFINVGYLREVVTFQQNTPTETDSGGELDVWADLLTTRGKMRKKTGSRGLEVGAVLFDSRYELITRYQTALDTALQADGNLQVIYKGRKFRLISMTIYEERFRYYVFELNEQHN